MTVNSDIEVDRILSAIESFAKSHCIGLDNFKAGGMTDQSSASFVPFLFTYDGRTYSINDKGEWNNFVELASEIVPEGVAHYLAQLSSLVAKTSFVLYKDHRYAH